jgi:hypothetical protein
MRTFPKPETLPAKATSPFPTECTGAADGPSISTPRFSIVTEPRVLAQKKGEKNLRLKVSGRG